MVWDTCVILYRTLAPHRLSAAASAACKKAEAEGAVVISSISILEIGTKIRKGKLEIGATLEDYVARLRQMKMEIVPIDADLWVRSVQLPWNHADPADRTIVATAIMRGLPIITPDQKIRDYYPNTIW